MPAAFAQLRHFVTVRTIPEARPDILTTILERVRRARLRRSEERLARLIERSGGRLTDDLEREIERHLFRD